MPYYFFDVRHSPGFEGLAVDPKGVNLANVSAAHEHALEEARRMIVGQRLSGIPDWFVCAFEISDEFGQILLTVPFAGTLTKEEQDSRIKSLQRTIGPFKRVRDIED